MTPATKPPSSRSRPSDEARAPSAKTVTTAIRIASCPLVSRLRSSRPQPRPTLLTASTAATTATAMKQDQDGCVRGRALGREHQRDQENGAELAGRAGSEEEGAEAGAQLAGVAQDRDQGPDRGGGERGPGEHEREHDTRHLEQGAERVGERQRQQPAEDGQPQWAAADALEVDLVAGEEEEHAEAEAGEELDEVIGLGQAEQLGSDHDAEHDLDDHNRQWQATPGHEPRQQRGERRDHGDRQEGLAVDVHHGSGRDPHAPGDGLMPQALVNDWPGSRRTRSCPLRNAFGGQVMGSTARLRRSTSGSGSPVNSIRYR